MSKPTPGPWLNASGPSSIVGWPIVGPRGLSICSITWYPRDATVSDADWNAFMAERRANARLIAAAPDLLEALKRAEMHFAMLPSGMDQPGSVMAQMRAAIAKAEGPPCRR